MNNESQNKAYLVIVWWMIWASLLIGVFVIYFFVGKDTQPRTGAGPDSVAWMIALVPSVISVALRWLIIPRITVAQTAWVLFIVGVAMAESTCIMGMFAFPERKLELFAVGVVGLVQMAPYFASRYTDLGQRD
jgi:hypothetical protein